MGKSKIYFILALIVVVICLYIGSVSLKRTFYPVIPSELFKTNQGKEVSLLDLKGKEIGVILYYSTTPCQGHKDCTQENIAVQKTLENSKRYCPYIVFGDLTEEGIKGFTKDIPAMIIHDSGKKIAKICDIRYYAVIFYRKNGEVILVKQGVNLSNLPGLVEHLNELVKN